MLTHVSIDSKDVADLFRRLEDWSKVGVKDDIETYTKRKAINVRDNLLQGKNAEGVLLAPVREATMNLPIKASGQWADRRIRKDVNSSRNPIVATGKTAKSISFKKISDNEFEISATGERQEAIIASNSTGRGGPKREVFVVTDKTEAEIEDAVEKSITKVIL